MATHAIHNTQEQLMSDLLSSITYVAIIPHQKILMVKEVHVTSTLLTFLTTTTVMATLATMEGLYTIDTFQDIAITSTSMAVPTLIQVVSTTGLTANTPCAPTGHQPITELKAF